MERVNKLLLIDDEITILRLLQMALIAEGFEVYTAQNGKLAMEIIATVTPDLIVTDVMMPQIGGLEFLRAVKAIPTLKNVPIIVLTSLRRYDDMKTIYELGADLCMTKPFEVTTLISSISKLLAGTFGEVTGDRP